MKYSSHSKQNRQKPCEMSTDNLSDFVAMQVGAVTRGPQECPQDPIKARLHVVLIVTQPTRTGSSLHPVQTSKGTSIKVSPMFTPTQ